MVDTRNHGSEPKTAITHDVAGPAWICGCFEKPRNIQCRAHVSAGCVIAGMRREEIAPWEARTPDLEVNSLTL